MSLTFSAVWRVREEIETKRKRSRWRRSEGENTGETEYLENNKICFLFISHMIKLTNWWMGRHLKGPFDCLTFPDRRTPTLGARGFSSSQEERRKGWKRDAQGRKRQELNKHFSVGKKDWLRSFPLVHQSSCSPSLAAPELDLPQVNFFERRSR